VGMHVNGEGGAAHGGCRRVERTEVVSAVGRWWQPQRLGGLGSSPYPPPLPCRSSPRPRSALAKRSTDWEDNLVGSEASNVPPPLALGQVYGEHDRVSVSGSGWWCKGDSLGGHEASATPPPRSTLTTPSYVSRFGSLEVEWVLAVVFKTIRRLKAIDPFFIF
jgi:hypothetical protein